ncbi:rhodanese-like domain-containing protein [Rhizomicrobium electricum]|uniref:Rhodanese-like domain-containing protein n=1 Tax=Rhizomicrobium electricum TaxID=480070 RepID=A0ABP3P387_9PROT|nr:rhodanese-like domain-containing protein [Rhizomicrobium electricum]NIJ47576.1 rhodanese-related sulfurtransferase [Rhizomicrobium electricum]
MATSLPSSYAGDVSVTEAWSALQADARAQLVDVRTTAEWTFVGLPDLSPVGRRVHCIEWVSFPRMDSNTGFLAALTAALGPAQDIAIYFLCRSGARSRAAAIAATAAGYTNSYNIAGGFEGDLDAEHHRGKNNGWKAAGLPWVQS